MIMLALMLALRGWTQWIGSFPGDRSVAVYAETARWTRVVRFIGPVFTDAGTAAIAILTVAIAAWALSRRVGARAALGVLLAAAVVIIVAVLKALWGPTPLWVSLGNSGLNYPSGHVAYTTAVFGYLLILGRRHRQPEVVAVSLLMIVGMGPMRVLTGTHLLSDAIGGYLLGGAWLILVMLWINLRSSSG